MSAPRFVMDGQIGNERLEPGPLQATGRLVDEQRRADLHDDPAKGRELGVSVTSFLAARLP